MNRLHEWMCGPRFIEVVNNAVNHPIIQWIEHLIRVLGWSSANTSTYFGDCINKIASSCSSWMI